MKTTHPIGSLLSLSLLCILVVMVYTVATSSSSIAAQDCAPAFPAAEQSNTQSVLEGDRATLLAGAGNIRLWGIESRTAHTNGKDSHQPAPEDVTYLQQAPDPGPTETAIGIALMTNTDDNDTVIASTAITIHHAYLPFICLPEKPVVPVWETILWDDFEGAWPGPWQLKNESSVSPYWWAQRDCRPYRGENSVRAVGTDSGSPIKCRADYPGNVWTYMIYGPFSLADSAGAELTFELWLSSILGEDRVYWGTALDGEDFWGFFMSGSTNGWEEITLDLRHIPTLGNLAGKSQVWILLAFISSDDKSLPEGAYVDDVLLRKSSVMPKEPAWQQFSFVEVGKPARGCFPEDPDGGFCHAVSNAEFAGAPPWVITVPAEGAMLRVTGNGSYDAFDVYDSEGWIGQTSTSSLSAECLDPNTCYLTPGMSSGEFPLAVGQHSITIVPSAIYPHDPYYTGNGFFRLDWQGLDSGAD